MGSDREEILHGNHVIAMLGNSGNNATPSGFRFSTHGPTIIPPPSWLEKIRLVRKAQAIARAIDRWGPAFTLCQGLS